jgi:transcriptional regulator with XRE-family HTH domain
VALAKVLRRLRKHRNWIQTRLAILAGTYNNRVSMIETGECLPTHDELKAFARVLGVADPEDLMREVADHDEPAPAPSLHVLIKKACEDEAARRGGK